MSLDNHKITTYEDNVADLPDYPSDAGYTAKQIKAIFDGRGDKEIKEKFNALIDELQEIIAELEKADDSAEQNAKDYADGLSVNYDAAGSAAAVKDDINAHVNDVDNPHNVTAFQLGLGEVDNTSDMDKPVSTLQAEAIGNVSGMAQKAKDDIFAHVNDADNPHNVTAEQIGAYTKEEADAIALNNEERIERLEVDIGDISTALDSIIAMQESYIGGTV